MPSRFPESEYIRHEVLVRDMQLLSEVKLTRKGLVRWLGLALGIVSPNESRTLALDVFEALCALHFKDEEGSFDQVLAQVNKVRGASQPPAGEKAVHYHLTQFRKLGIIEHRDNKWRFLLDPKQEDRDLATALHYSYQQKFDLAFDKIKKAEKALERL